MNSYCKYKIILHNHNTSKLSSPILESLHPYSEMAACKHWMPDKAQRTEMDMSMKFDLMFVTSCIWICQNENASSDENCINITAFSLE